MRWEVVVAARAVVAARLRQGRPEARWEEAGWRHAGREVGRRHAGEEAGAGEGGGRHWEGRRPELGREAA